MSGRTRKGDLRAYWLGTVVCIGGFLFGYDSGIMGGVLTLASFMHSFNFTAKQSTKTNSLAIGIQQAGALVGCFAIYPLSGAFGRRPAIALCSFLFCIGALIQTLNTHSLPAFYVGRVIAGLGLGGSSVVVSMFNAEMAPKEIRGRLGSFYQLMYTFGIFTSYWVDYAVAETMPAVVRQWQVPIGLQIVPAALLGLGMLTVPESVRWLSVKGREDAAWKSLTWIRADDSERTLKEMEEIRASIAQERHAKEGFHPRELAERDNAKRLGIAVAVFLCQQSVGSTALAYYGPQFFKILVGPGNSNLLLTAIFGAVKIFACGLFVFGFSERIGRKTALTSGVLFMSLCMIITAIVTKVRPPPGGGVITSSGIGTVALIYLNIMAYNFSWGSLPWPIVSEIFPPRIRDVGVATGVGSQWLFNFVYSFSVSYMIDSMGWATFLLFGIFDLAVAAFTVTCLKETRGRSLEEIQRLYASSSTASISKNYDGEGGETESGKAGIGRGSDEESASVGKGDGEHAERV